MNVEGFVFLRIYNRETAGGTEFVKAWKRASIPEEISRAKAQRRKAEHEIIEPT